MLPAPPRPSEISLATGSTTCNDENGSGGRGGWPVREPVSVRAPAIAMGFSMRLTPSLIRGIAASSLVVHVVAGLLAMVAHDHGPAGGCCGAAASPAAVVSADGNANGGADGRGHDAPNNAPRWRSCRHQDCGHGPAAEQGGGERPRQAAPSRLSVGSKPQAGCLACEFLTGAIAILPWTPAVGPAAARWEDPPLARPLPRAAVIAASFPRGPPV